MADNGHMIVYKFMIFYNGLMNMNEFEKIDLRQNLKKILNNSITNKYSPQW